MIKKNTKIATWSLVVSVTTLLLVVSVLLVTRYTDIIEKFDFFNTKELKADLKESYERIDFLLKEKDVLMRQLSEKLREFEALKMKNDVLKSDLESKNQEIKVLTEKVNALEKNVSSLLSFKKELNASIKKNEKTTQRIDQLVAENLKAKSVNEKKTIQKASIDVKNTIQKASSADTSIGTINKNTVLDDSPIRDIVNDEENNIRLLNSNVKTFFIKDSGVKKETNNSNKVNTLVLSYTLFKNKGSNKLNNKFYIQIFDTNNKNIGNTQSRFIEGKELVYSFVSEVDNKNSINTITEQFSTEGLNLDKGVYFLNIFNEYGKLLSTKSFRLE